MAVIIGHGVRSDIETLDMNNGLMSVFISVLTIAASSLAQDERQKNMAVWLASHDQEVFGLGVVGFDLCSYPWVRATFEEGKAFLLSCIRAASAQHGWSKLDYSPRLDWIVDSLAKFDALVQSFLAEHILPEAEREPWYFDTAENFELCSVHDVYRHPWGCILCHNN